MYEIVFTRTVQKKHVPLLRQAGLLDKVNELIDVLRINPFQSPPPYEKLSNQMFGAYSRRINIQHRLVYTVDSTDRKVHVVSMWSHYEQM